MNIIRLVKEHTKEHGWPTSHIRLGPATCGQPLNGKKRPCREAHAYAQSVEHETPAREMMWSFTFDRPCNRQEVAWDPATRKREGLDARRED